MCMILKLFTTFFKIGLFTFGGGYGMIALVKEECVDKNNWIEEDEFVNLIAIAESTPGPIAINMATYIGYKQAKVLGSIIATFGVVLPSLIIIYIIAKFLDNFLNIKIVADAFFGIRIAVSLIILRTAYKLFISEYKMSKHKALTLILFILYTVILLYTDIMNINISSVTLIMSAMLLGLILLFIRRKSNDLS